MVHRILSCGKGVRADIVMSFDPVNTVIHNLRCVIIFSSGASEVEGDGSATSLHQLRLSYGISAKTTLAREISDPQPLCCTTSCR